MLRAASKERQAQGETFAMRQTPCDRESDAKRREETDSLHLETLC